MDKTYITEGEEGYRLAKVRIRDERIPAIGDKFCSRCGQKGTIGLVIDEKNMPFTENGIRPDIIINPHALPSRMTIGQLLECIMGKTSVMLGGLTDCTPFHSVDPDKIGDILETNGFQRQGNEILYNGITGKQMTCQIFMGPTFYQRLKHMVIDKQHSRSRGPIVSLTRQPCEGRARDGGLRVGEMERDSIVAHGIAGFLKESMMERSDKYYTHICQNSGRIAIVNPNENLFISPDIDGPMNYDIIE